MTTKTKAKKMTTAQMTDALARPVEGWKTEQGIGYSDGSECWSEDPYGRGRGRWVRLTRYRWVFLR